MRTVNPVTDRARREKREPGRTIISGTPGANVRENDGKPEHVDLNDAAMSCSIFGVP